MGVVADGLAGICTAPNHLQCKEGTIPCLEQGRGQGLAPSLLNPTGPKWQVPEP
jgi:hypothetical protein